MGALESKVAIVTGGGSGIGKAIAELFAREGASVVVSDIDEQKGKDVTDAIVRLGGKAVFFRADTSQAEDHRRLVEEAVGKFGGLHIAVNNAGIGGPIAPTGEYPLDGWQRVIDINLSGVFYGLRYQIPAMLASKGGNIVNISSILGMVATRNSPAYVAAKHGVVGLTKTAALEYGAQNIRINAVGPGYIHTPMLGGLDEATLKAVEGLHPIGRLGEAPEVAELVLFLVSARSSFITGSYYPVDGGYLAQ